jgi:hypothetical protein
MSPNRGFQTPSCEASAHVQPILAEKLHLIVNNFLNLTLKSLKTLLHSSLLFIGNRTDD